MIMIIELPIVKSDKSIPVEPGTPVYLGELVSRNPTVAARCGHVIGIGENTVRVYSRGFSSIGNQFDEVVKKVPLEILGIYNRNGLFLVDVGNIPELNFYI